MPRVITLILVGIFFITLLLARMTAGGFLLALLKPIQAMETAAARDISLFSLPLVSKEKLLRENNELRAELTSVQADAADRALLQAQITELTAALGRSNEGPKKILAYVIARPPQLPYDSLMLDVGTDEGVEVGDIVGRGTTALGVVDAVAASHARAVLFSSPGMVTHSILATIPVDLRGEGGGSFTAEVPQQTTVSIGDGASLPSLSGSTVATVAGIDATTGKTFETLHLTMAASIYELPNVEVWLTKLPQTDMGTTSNSL